MSTNRPQKGVAASRTVATGNVQRASGKAISLQARLLRHPGEWLVLVDDRRVPPPNILAERDLRPPVVLRKIRFSHRSDEGAKRMAALMTISETAPIVSAIHRK